MHLNRVDKRSEYAKTLKSVLKINDLAYNNENALYLGIKSTDTIPLKYFEGFSKNSFFIHTIDKMSMGGRAIDVDLLNPLTGRCMTGSSSGTAINVFLGINDIGIGTDGGGSVLAPACSLNLYGFISKEICKDHMSRFKKTSTDGIEFYPSIGYLSKRLDLIEKICRETIEFTDKSKKLDVKIGSPRIDFQKQAFLNANNKLEGEIIDLFYQGIDRELMIKELTDFDFDNNILVTFEGPIDLLGYGDSIIGHYGDVARSIQEKGHKYYLKVVNILGLSAIIVPTQNLAVGTLIICKSEPSAIVQLFEIARKLDFKRSKLEEKYFSV